MPSPARIRGLFLSSHRWAQNGLLGIFLLLLIPARPFCASLDRTGADSSSDADKLSQLASLNPSHPLSLNPGESIPGAASTGSPELPSLELSDKQDMPRPDGAGRLSLIDSPALVESLRDKRPSPALRAATPDAALQGGNARQFFSETAEEADVNHVSGLDSGGAAFDGSSASSKAAFPSDPPVPNGYDYFGIKSQLHNADAVRALVAVFQDFASEITQTAAAQGQVRSVVNQERAEHAAKNALEAVLDHLVHSEGFDGLSPDQKWERFKADYIRAASGALREQSMTPDTAKKVQRLLEADLGDRFLARLRTEFIDRYDMWNIWGKPQPETSQAPEPAAAKPAPRERTLSKIRELPAYNHAGPDSVLFIDSTQQLAGPAFTQAILNNVIKPVLKRLGVAFLEGGKFHNGPPIVVRTQARATDVQAAARAALELVNRHDILQVLLHPRALALLLKPKEEEPPARPLPRRAAEAARDTLRKFLYAVIDQGSKRTPMVLYAAADALAAIADEKDLEKARTHWIRFETFETRYAELAAGAMIIARKGGGPEDEARLLRAIDYYRGENHTTRPLETRYSAALSRLLDTDDPRRLRELLERYATARTKDSRGYLPHGEKSQEEKNPFLLDALYRLLAKRAGPEAREILQKDYEQGETLHRVPAFHDYLMREDPDSVRQIYRRWKDTEAQPDESTPELGQLLLAIAEFGDPTDLEIFLRTSWMKDSLIHRNNLIFGQALARMIKRLGVFERMRPQIEEWLQKRIEDPYAFKDLNAAIAVVNELGDARDLTPLEKIIGAHPYRVDDQNLATQQNAAEAWARIVVRAGLMERYLTELEPAKEENQRAKTRITSMLTDMNGAVNVAALDAIRLYFGGEDVFPL